VASTSDSRLAQLAAGGDPDGPPQLPLELVASLGQPVALAAFEQRWGQASALEGDGVDGWRRLGWRQSWFGLPELKTRYTLDPAGGLVRIDVFGPDFEAIAGSMRAALGEPDDAGRSPQFLNSDRYQVWLREGLRFSLEDFKPGFSLGILPVR
jgi:hypothetical protein